MDLMSLLAGAGNVPLPGLGGGPLPGMGGGVPIEDMSGQPPSLPLPPSMPVAQALAGGPQQNPMIAQLLALAGQGGAQQQPTGIPLPVMRMMLFQQLNQPGRGPFTSIVNPIVAALTARQLAPYYQQQQQQQLEAAAAKQRLDSLQGAASIVSSLATAGVKQGQAEKLLRESEWWKNLPDEKKNEAMEVLNKLRADPNAQLGAEVRREGITATADTARANRESRERVAGANIASRERVAGANIASREGIAGRRLEFNKQQQADLQDWREEQKSQFDWGEWYKDRRLETTEAGKNIRASKTQEAQDKRAAATIKAQADRALNQMTYQGMLQAQRLTALRDSRSDEAAQIKTDLDLYGKMLKDDPDGARGFFNETIVPQYEALYGDTFDIGSPGMEQWIRSWASPLTLGYVDAPSDLYSRKPSTTTTKPPAYQPVVPPGASRPSRVEEQANQMPPDNPNDPMGNLIGTGKKRKFTLGQ